MEKSRKYIVLTILVAMVAVAGYLNLNYNQPGDRALTETAGESLGAATMVSGDVEEESEPTATKPDELANAREAKSTARSRAMEMLNTIIKDEATDSESREKASAELVAMADSMEAEGVIEGILKTKGYPDCVVFITNGVATVSVKTDKPLTASDASKIQDVVKSNGKVAGDKITISQIK